MSLISSEGIGLLFKARGDTDDARKAFNDLEKDIKQTAGTAETGSGGFVGLAQKLGMSAEGAAGLAEAMPVVGTALAAVASVAATTIGVLSAVGVALFGLAQQASDFGSEIKDASDKTGISAESLSALKFAADQSGSSLEQIGDSITRFSKTVAEAASGSDEAKNKLIALGIDPQEAIDDLDGALADVFKRIESLPPGVQQTKAAIDAFGKSGADIIPVIKSFDGDMEGLIKRAKELGVVMTDEGAAKADEFGDSLDTLKAQATGIANTFALEFMPDITNAMQSVTQFLINNKDTVIFWGQEVGSIIRGIGRVFGDLKDLAGQALDAIGLKLSDTKRSALETLIVLGPILGPLSLVGGVGAGASGSTPALSTPTPAYNFDAENQKKAAEEAKRAREKREQEEMAARTKFNTANKESIQQAFDELREITKKQYEENLLDADQYHAAVLEDEQQFVAQMTELTKQGFAAQKEQAKNQTEKDALDIQQRTALAKITTDSEKRIADAEKLTTERQKKESDTRVKQTQDSLQKQLELEQQNLQNRQLALERNFKDGLISEEQYQKQKKILVLNYTAATEKDGRLIQIDLAESFLNFKKNNLEKQLEAVKGNAEEEARIRHQLLMLNREIEAEYFKQNIDDIEEQKKKIIELAGAYERLGKIIQAQNAETDRGAQERHGIAPRDFQSEASPLGESILTTVDEAGNRVHAFAGAWDALKDAAGSALSSMAQGIGSMIQNMVLLGNTGGNSFRKLVASVLAGVSAQAAVLAVMELAYGIAALTPWGLAIYGNPALHFKAAALFGGIALGAGIAGRFAAGDEFKNQNSGAFGSAGGAGASSGTVRTPQNDSAQVITMGANSPFAREPVKLEVHNKTGLSFDDFFEIRVMQNGKLRGTIQNVAEGLI